MIMRRYYIKDFYTHNDDQVTRQCFWDFVSTNMEEHNFKLVNLNRELYCIYPNEPKKFWKERYAAKAINIKEESL